MKNLGARELDVPFDKSEEQAESRSRGPHFARWNLPKVEEYAHRMLKDGAASAEVVAVLEKRFDLPRRMAKEVTEEKQRELGK